MLRWVFMALLVAVLAGCGGAPAKKSPSNMPRSGDGAEATTANAKTGAAPVAPKSHCQNCEAAVSGDHNCFSCARGCTFCASCTLAYEQRCPNCAGKLEPRP